jgi:hypothetical protein
MALGPALMFGGTGRIRQARSPIAPRGPIGGAIPEARIVHTALRIIDNEFDGAASAPVMTKLPRQFTCWRLLTSSAGLQRLFWFAPLREPIPLAMHCSITDQMEGAGLDVADTPLTAHLKCASRDH